MRYLTIITFLLTIITYGQHPHDVSQQARLFDLQPCDAAYVNNYTALEDIDISNMIQEVGTGMNIDLSSGGYDIWFEFIKYDSSSPLFIWIYPPIGHQTSGDLQDCIDGIEPWPLGWCNDTLPYELPFGLFQGWVWNRWLHPMQGAAPESCWPVWGTNSDWLTAQYPAIIINQSGSGYDEAGWDDNDPIIYPDQQPLNADPNYYDPTRQSWKIDLWDAPDGQYYAQLTTRGNCRGEVWVRICEGYQILEISQPWDTVIQEMEEPPRPPMMWDILGRRVR